MDTSIFDFSSYKAYLESRVGTRSQRRGVKSAMAKALQCQPTYISQVLHGNAHLSLEQADRLNDFLGHSKDEGFFFLLLVQLERAGTVSLRRHFQEQLDQIKTKRMILSERIGSKNSLSAEEQARYYSSWHFAAIHIALTIPELRQARSLANFFKLPLKKVNEVLDFLTSLGLAKLGDKQSYEVGTTTIWLGNDSPNIFRHHSNWRQQAIESLDREELEDLHYSAIVSLSKKDVVKFKDQLLERLKQDQEMIRNSPAEELYSFCIDLFHLQR